jgi:hypothetical protein
LTSARRPARQGAGISIDGLRCGAVALAFDLAGWRAHFVGQWPEGSPAYARYYSRITGGTPLRLEQAIRGTVTQTARH